MHLDSGIIAAIVGGSFNLAVALIVIIEARRTRNKVAEVHTLVNSGLEKLVASTERAASAEGKAAGLAEGAASEKARADAVLAAKGKD